MSDPAPVGPLVHRCQKCNAVEAGKKKLLRCRGCLAVRYCNLKHLKADLPNHKSACNGIKKARVKVGKEAAILRSRPADGDTPANVFETAVGDFLRFGHTFEYMKARYIFAENLYVLGTLDSITLALRHMQDTIRLSRTDPQHVRIAVPWAMLCLDLDQESCDFIKKWGFGSPWSNNVQGTDVLESAKRIAGKKSLRLERAMPLLLLRLKLLVDVINVIKARKVLSRTRLPVEIQNNIEKKMVRSPLSAHLYQESTAALLKIQHKIIRGVLEAHSVVADCEDCDLDFLSQLLAGDKLLNLKVGVNEPWIGGFERDVAKFSYPAWRANEGVLQLLADAQASGVKILKIALQGAMDSESSARGNFSRSGTVLLSTLGLNFIWQHLEWAVEEATYLGPPAERPSEYLAKVHQRFWICTSEYEQLMFDIRDECFIFNRPEGLRSIIYRALYGAKSDEGAREMIRMLARGIKVERPQVVRSRYSESRNVRWSFEELKSFFLEGMIQ